MAIKKIVQQRRNETNTDWDILHAETSADIVAYDSSFHSIDNNVKEILDGLLYLFRFVNLYINGGSSTSTYYTGSFIDGGSSSTVGSPNAIMDAGYSQEYNQL